MLVLYGFGYYPSIYRNGPANTVQFCIELINCLIYKGNNAGNALPNDLLQMLMHVKERWNIVKFITYA